MTRPAADVERVAALLSQGVSQAEAARRTGIPRATLRYWCARGIANEVASRTRRGPGGLPCDRSCAVHETVHRPAYAYLLGLYLGDGCLSRHPRHVYRLRITLDDAYPRIIEECRRAVGLVSHNAVNSTQCLGCTEVGASSKHWPCLFPQHGPGPKHKRRIILEAWQRQIALDVYPHLLLRGLLYSDGCRSLNRVNGRVYPRYLFSNRSADIRALFIEACGRVRIECRPSNDWTISVARRKSVARLDLYVGKKA